MKPATLRRIRAKTRLTQVQMAEKLMMSRRAYQALELGEVRIKGPVLIPLTMLAKELDIHE